VLEYLRHIEYKRTAEAFALDRSRPPKVRPTADRVSEKKHILKQICDLFDAGAHDEFFELVEKRIPAGKMKHATVLFFNIHIYFAIAPLHHHSKHFSKLKGGVWKEKAREAMSRFKSYLEKRKAAANPSLMAYYGLPFIPNPGTHPSFKHLFESEWLEPVRQRMERFMTLHVNLDNAPELMTLFKQSVNSKNDAGEEDDGMPKTLSNEGRASSGKSADRRKAQDVLALKKASQVSRIVRWPVCSLLFSVCRLLSARYCLPIL
jgi:hypothetical protein